MNSKVYYRWLTALLGMMLVSFSALAQQPEFLTNGLVAYYPFDKNLQDASGKLTNVAVLHGVSLGADRFNNPSKAIEFSGKSGIGYVDLGSGVGPKAPINMTQSFWIRSTQPLVAGKHVVLVSKFTKGTSGWNTIEFDVNKKLTSEISNPFYTSATLVGADPQAVLDGRWHQICSTRSAGLNKLFLDGAIVASGFDSAAIAPDNDGSPLWLGSNYWATDPNITQGFVGMLDDYRLYNRALSDSEVAALYKHETTPPDNDFITNGLVAYFPFDEKVVDLSVSKLGASVVGNLTFATDRFGESSKSLNFDGNKSSLLVNDPNQLINFEAKSDGYTISTWVYLNSNAGVQTLLSARGSGANSYHSYMLSYIPSASASGAGVSYITNNAFVFDAWSGGPNPLVYSADALTINTWYNVVAVVENGIFSIYVNGVDRTIRVNGGSAAGFGTTKNSDGKRAFGSDPATPNGQFLNGKLDDVRVYNRALTAGEVAALYLYESVPQKTDPRQATATATVVNGFVVGATITDVGSGYTKAPKVVISGGGGTGATATATIDANGAVSGIKIVTSGSGYTGIPTIIIDPPPFPPSQAKGTSTLINGFVTGVNITDTGHGYEGVVPPVTFLGGGGSGAKGTAIVSNGMVTGISMTASGSGYTNAPYVLIAAPPGLASADIAVKTVEVTLHLIPGYTYKIQTTTDAGTTWIDVETGILAVDKTLIRSFDVTTNTQLFRVVQVN